MSSVFPVPPEPPVDPTSLAAGKYSSTNVINRVFKIILEMVNALQNVAAVQAQRLTFMSSWQKAYTDALAQIHTFAKDNGDRFSFDTTDYATTRDDLNRLNAQFTSTLQNRQSVVSDDAKALQSNVNQSNDAVNQHLNLANTILDELRSLLGSIFK
jgi:hypothetical protein